MISEGRGELWGEGGREARSPHLWSSPPGELLLTVLTAPKGSQWEPEGQERGAGGGESKQKEVIVALPKFYTGLQNADCPWGWGRRSWGHLRGCWQHWSYCDKGLGSLGSLGTSLLLKGVTSACPLLQAQGLTEAPVLLHRLGCSAALLGQSPRPCCGAEQGQGATREHSGAGYKHGTLNLNLSSASS